VSPISDKKIQVILEKKKGKSFFSVGTNFRNMFVNSTKAGVVVAKGNRN